MRRVLNKRTLTITAALLAAFLCVPVIAGEDEPKVVIPFDFQSKFDDGRYGQIVGDMVWKKLNRFGRFIIPEAMLRLLRLRIFA